MQDLEMKSMANNRVNKQLVQCEKKINQRGSDSDFGDTKLTVFNYPNHGKILKPNW